MTEVNIFDHKDLSRLAREWSVAWDDLAATPNLYGAQLRGRLGELHEIANEIAHYAVSHDIDHEEVGQVLEVQHRILHEVMHSEQLHRADLG